MSSFYPKAFFDARIEQRDAFLRAHVKKPFQIESLAEDWASRRYFRITNTDGTYILMEAVPDHIPTATMGHKLSAFLKVGSLLHERGIHTPEILAVDEQEGYVLLEDFGNTSVNSAIESGKDTHELYAAATDVLIAMRDRISLDDLFDFNKYKDSYIHTGRQRIVDWYIPATRKAKNGDDLVASYIGAWDEVAAQLPSPPIGFVHGDYHLQNLMLLPNGSCGVLDFQDAMAGPVPYDLANLLENIRRDVPKDIYDAMLKRFGGDETFNAWFRVMATQFHCRIIGQVLRLAIVSDKTELLQFMPRIQNYIVEGLKDPVLKPVANWMKDQKVDFTAMEFNLEDIKKFIRPDAF